VQEPHQSLQITIAKVDAIDGSRDEATDERVLAGRAALERHAFGEALGLLAEADADQPLSAERSGRSANPLLLVELLMGPAGRRARARAAAAVRIAGRPRA
jgi:hypothetical protein